GRHVAGERASFGGRHACRAGREGVDIGDGDRLAESGGGGARRVVGQDDGDIEVAVVGISVVAGDGERAGAAGDGAGAGGAVAPVDGGGEVGGDVARIGVGERRHGPGERRAFGRGNGRRDRAERIALGHVRRA